MEQSKSYIDGNNTVIWYLPSKGRRYYHRLNSPAIEWADGSKEWWLNNKRHREDGPAIERADGTKRWCLKGKLHREDGPAIEYADGIKYWFLNGNKLPKKEIEFWLTENDINLKTNEGKIAFKLRWI